MTKDYDRLLSRLDDANALGISICGDASLAIRRLTKDIDEWRERHKDSRADRLAAAFQTLRQQLLQLRDVTRDLEMHEDFNIDVDDVRKILNNQLDAIEKSIDPEPIGERIVNEISRLSNVESELRDLYARTARDAGLSAETLLSLGIFVDGYRSDQKTQLIHGMNDSVGTIYVGSLVTVTLKTTNKRGIEYLADLLSQLGH